MKSLSQIVYDEVFRASDQIGFNTFDFLPPAGTSLPFVTIGEVSITPLATKSRLLADITVTIDLWGSANDRQLIANMQELLLHQLSKIRTIEGGLRLRMQLNDTNSRLLKDNSTDVNLWHAICTPRFTAS